MSVTHGHCDARPMLCQYQFILLGDRGTPVLTTYHNVAPESATAGGQIRNLLIASSAVTAVPLTHTSTA